ncbi:MAG: DUF2939 domain-containing protein [Phenylobacterium sp.]
MRRFAPLLALLLVACATAQRYDAASDVHALLVSIRDDDRATFERHVDRPALKRSIEARAVAELRGSDAPKGLQRFGAALAAPLVSLTADLLIQPQVFRWVAASYGYRRSDPIPGALAIAPALRPTGRDRVCAVAKAGGDCVLTFTREDGVWKLSGFEGELALLGR